MRKIYFILCLLTLPCWLFAQDAQLEKIKLQLKQHTEQDTSRVNRLNQLGVNGLLPIKSYDTIINEALTISEKINYSEGKAYALINLANLKYQQGDKAAVLPLLQQAQSIAEKKEDQTLMVNVLLALGRIKSQSSENKQALDYYLQAEALAEKLPNKAILSRTERIIASLYQISLSNYPKAMEWTFRSINTAEEADCKSCLTNSYSTLASIYTVMGDHEKGLVYYKKALDANNQLGNKTIQYNLLINIGERYRLMGNYPEALRSYKEGLKGNTSPYNIELNQSNQADVYVRMGNLPMAFKYAFASLTGARKLGDMEGQAWIYGILGRAYIKAKNPDSAIYYANLGLEAANKTGTIEFMRDNSGVLTNAYAYKKDFANAYKYQNQYISYRDSMVNAQVTNQSNVLQYNFDIQKKQAQIAALNQDKKLQKIFLFGALIVLGMILVTVVVLLKNNRQKQKANVLLSKQKQMIEQQRDETNKALAGLQLTQRQLIQSEKMASLGELTAGIAHEIQNPLNFVNNFSEVNQEMIDELVDEINAGNKEQAITIATDIKLNAQKINHHGKRADFIVKGMLQHSRNNTGERQLTDINVLADEFFKLSYHGLRAKDKSFNAELITNFDRDLPKLNVISQDVGRVLLNLFNNAFYAVRQKQKISDTDYKPEVTVSTFIPASGGWGVKVKDNGNGIPEAIKDKIMQPFFTTKPTGEGTGLGLSLSYDIIVKGHGGRIEIDTKEGEYTVFTIYLPL